LIVPGPFLIGAGAIKAIFKSVHLDRLTATPCQVLTPSGNAPSIAKRPSFESKAAIG
jgi:hypothetical protein